MNSDGEDTQRIEFAKLKYQVGIILVEKFLQYNDGKFHAALELNPATHALTEFIDNELASLRDQLKQKEEENRQLASEFIKVQKKISDYADEYTKSGKVDTSMDNINYFIGKSEAYQWAAKTLMNSIQWLGLLTTKTTAITRIQGGE